MFCSSNDRLLMQAADEIMELCETNRRLRAALQSVLNTVGIETPHAIREYIEAALRKDYERENSGGRWSEAGSKGPAS
jgi:hypothetical protein